MQAHSAGHIIRMVWYWLLGMNDKGTHQQQRQLQMDAAIYLNIVLLL